MMTNFFNAKHELPRLALWSLLLGGCWTAPDCSVKTSDAGPECEPEYTGGLESDDDRLLGRIVSDPGGTWGVSGQAVRKGLVYDFQIHVPASIATTNLRVESSDPDVIVVVYERVEDDCDGSLKLFGTVDYKEAGEAAIVVYDDRDELDRFTMTVHELDRIEVMASLEDTDGGTGFDDVVIDALTLDEPLHLQLVLRSASGQALAGARQTYWTIDNHDVAAFEGESIGRALWTRIVPVATGSTTLRVRSTGFDLTIPVTVTGVPDAGSLEER